MTSDESFHRVEFDVLSALCTSERKQVAASCRLKYVAGIAKLIRDDDPDGVWINDVLRYSLHFHECPGADPKPLVWDKVWVTTKTTPKTLLVKGHT